MKCEKLSFKDITLDLLVIIVRLDRKKRIPLLRKHTQELEATCGDVVDDHVKIHYSATSPTTSRIREECRRNLIRGYIVSAAVWMV
jgi:hypothetical protein